MSTPHHKDTSLLHRVRDFQEYLTWEIGPGSHIAPIYTTINLQKAGSLFFCLFLMRRFQNWSTQAWMYTIAHGTYGLCWILKHFAFADPAWNRKAKITGLLNSLIFPLLPYWIGPYLLIARKCPQPSIRRCAIALIVYVLGLATMLVSDAQKYFTLRVQRGLISDGMYRYIRHPNYLGEMLVYGSFAAMVPHWAPKAVLAAVWSGLFSVNILAKEASLSRHAGWAEYYKRSGLLLPPVTAVLSDLFACADKKSSC